VFESPKPALRLQQVGIRASRRSGVSTRCSPMPGMAGGEYAFRMPRRGAMFTPFDRQIAARDVRKSYSTYKEYAKIINDHPRLQMNLRWAVQSSSSPGVRRCPLG